jgi:hypothetical protein
VASMVPNGAAARDGQIREGDELVGINSISINQQTTLENLRQLILGPPGTFVMLSMRRRVNGGSARDDYWYYDLELQRGDGGHHAQGRCDVVQVLSGGMIDERGCVICRTKGAHLTRSPLCPRVLVCVRARACLCVQTRVSLCACLHTCLRTCLSVCENAPCLMLTNMHHGCGWYVQMLR